MMEEFFIEKTLSFILESFTFGCIKVLSNSMRNRVKEFLDEFLFLNYALRQMQFPGISKRRGFPSLFIPVFLAYLLLFSGFAYYHAYSENEIFDSHECAIGDWVQHSAATLSFVVVLSVFLFIASKIGNKLQCLFRQTPLFLDPPRGPPLLLRS